MGPEVGMPIAVLAALGHLPHHVVEVVLLVPPVTLRLLLVVGHYVWRQVSLLGQRQDSHGAPGKRYVVQQEDQQRISVVSNTIRHALPQEAELQPRPHGSLQVHAMQAALEVGVPKGMVRIHNGPSCNFHPVEVQKQLGCRNECFH